MVLYVREVLSVYFEYPVIRHEVDFCVVGGGLAGLCAAVAAARGGAKVALVQERPMLGGNASSEIRMWVCGAQGDNRRETGIIEEISLENLYINPDKNYSIWDGVLLGMVKAEANIELLLNTSVNSLKMEDGGAAIRSVTGWQMTTQTYHEINAKLFADCSGDSVLAPLSGAEFRLGREARAEFGESIGPEVADSKTMGMSVLLQAREESRPSAFTPPEWVPSYTAVDLGHRAPCMQSPTENFWYIELGGDRDSIGDTEVVRDELLRVAYGVWDYVKNAPENIEKNKYWRLDWVGILPGKRESRRYVGDHILTQLDVEAGGRFEDVAAYGGWPMDDHDPAGFASDGPPNVNHPAPSPFGIPYRCMYSRNIDNLFFAGRNISATHAAMSSTRVMATCSTIGQAVGTAAAIAIREGLSPRGVYEARTPELKQALMAADCYLPGNVRQVPEAARGAALIGGGEQLRNGIDRPIDGEDNGCYLPIGQTVEYEFDPPRRVSRARMVFDSDLNRAGYTHENGRNMICNRPIDRPDAFVPPAMTRSYLLEAVLPSGEVIELAREENNYQRLRVYSFDVRARAVRFTPLGTWGAGACHMFAFEVE